MPEQVLVERDFGRVLYSVTKFYYRGLLIDLTAMPRLRGLLFARTSVPKLEDYYSDNVSRPANIPWRYCTVRRSSSWASERPSISVRLTCFEALGGILYYNTFILTLR